jgi:hypothetical protein
MPNYINPPSQKAEERQIVIDAPWGTCFFSIRPEDLQWQEPSRISVQQTLGGAWVDAFGPGVATITISGNTGWKQAPGWEEQFRTLHDVAFKGWHDWVRDTKDPESAEMLFIDDLDGRVVQVVPQVFTLKRNKSRPLLMQYTIQFAAVRDANEMLPAGASAMTITSPNVSVPLLSPAMDSLLTQIARAQAMVAVLKNPSAGGLLALLSQVSPSLAASVANVMTVVSAGLSLAGSITGVSSSSAAPSGVSNATLSVPVAMAQASESDIPQELSVAMTQMAGAVATAVGHIIQVASATPEQRGMLLSMASDMRLVACLFSDAFRASLLLYPDYDPLYGASNCSSTSGGRRQSPWRDINPFELLAPVPTKVVDVDVEAMHAARELSGSDPVLDPWSITRVSDRLETIARGTSYREVA